MNLKQIDLILLRGIVADVDAKARLKPLDRNKIHSLRRERNDLIGDAKRGIIAYTPANWFGRELTPSERTMVPRSIRKMAALGLVQIAYAKSDRMTAVRITPAARALIASGEIAFPELEANVE